MYKSKVNFKVITGIDDFPSAKNFLFHRLRKYNDEFIQTMVDELDGYKLLPEPETITLPRGCFIRNMTKFTHALKGGGFVIEQNGKWITLSNGGKLWKIDMTTNIIFIKEKTKIQTSKFRSMLEKLIDGGDSS